MPFPLLGAILPSLISGGLGLLTGSFGKSKGQAQGAFPQQGGQGNPLTGYGAATQQLPRFSQEQQGLLNSLIPQVQQGLQNNPANFAPIEAKARQNFNTKTVPSIAERFTGMGGGQRSSAFQSALGTAGSDLETNLAALGSQHGLQQQQLLQQLLGQALSPSFENIYIPQSSGLFGGLAGGLGQGVGAAAPGLLSSLFSGQQQGQQQQQGGIDQNTFMQLLQFLQQNQQGQQQGQNKLGGFLGGLPGIQQGYNLARS